MTELLNLQIKILSWHHQLKTDVHINKHLSVKRLPDTSKNLIRTSGPQKSIFNSDVVKKIK